MFIWIYRFLFAPLVLLGLPKYLIHVRRRGGYREKFGTRFGRGLELPAKRNGYRRIWIQAVSLGEILAIEPLMRGLAKKERIEIFLTVTTSTGFAEAKKRYSGMVVGLSYFPADFWPFSNKVWNIVQPDLAMCAETELWPEHLQQATKRGVPFLLVNGRLSDRSYSVTKTLTWLVRGSLLKISRVFACSEIDRERFLELGVPADRIELTGNMKVDVEVTPVLNNFEKEQLRRTHGLGNGFVLLGSSIWPGEESVLIDAFIRIREKTPDARLLIVPRHAEDRGVIEETLKEKALAFSWVFKSRGLPEGEVDILVADTHGELRMLSQLADLALIGKSLPPYKEGQTPVECGALGVPMVMGKGMSNFRSIRAGLRRFGAMREAADAEQAVELMVELSRDSNTRAAMSKAGKNWHSSSRGAVERTLIGIDHWI